VNLGPVILFDRINEDFKVAFKAREEAKVSTLRMLKAALKNKQIDFMHALSDEEVLVVVKSQIKQLKDSVEAFVSGGRPELAASSEAEARVLEAYLPAQMDEVTLATVVKEALAGAGLSSKADQGKAMGVAMKAVAGKADGARVRAIVESLLVVSAAAAFFLPAFGVFAAGPIEPVRWIFADTVIRIIRISLLLLGVLSVNFVLVGAFSFMTAGGRDDVHEHAIKKMAFGLFTTVVVMALFAVATNALQKGL